MAEQFGPDALARVQAVRGPTVDFGEYRHLSPDEVTARLRRTRC
jgi:hypothetical protein